MDGKSAANTRSRSTRDLTPCLPDTTTGGATGAGNETTETKAGTGTETEAAILAAGATPAPAPAAQDGLAQTRRDDQACATHQSTPYFLSHKRAPPKSRIQTDVTTEEIGTRTGETGIPGTPVGAMTESDGTQLGGTGTRTGIGRTGRRGKARRVRMQNPSPSALENGVHG